DKHPCVAGGFVWSGGVYIGEPTPYYGARSSYFGVIDLAGFKKDRFYLYQSYWRPEVKIAHFIPNWTWPGGEGQITPVHVFSSGDEAELFLNGVSLGRKKKAQYEYRFRWDSVLYQPGELKVVTYKDGSEWATNMVKTAGAAATIELTADRTAITADGLDLCFVSLRVLDANGVPVPQASNRISFEVSGPAEIVATDNGDPTSFESFASHEQNAFNGCALVIVRPLAGSPGTITITAKANGLKEDQI